MGTNSKLDSANAKCPFYVSSTGKRIRCAGGFAPEVCLSTHDFATSEDKNQHFEKYCQSYKYYYCNFANREIRIYRDGEE